MKAFSKIICICVVLTMLFHTGAFAENNREYADTLYDLGLFAGTDKGYELDRCFTREEAATVIVRLLGEADNLDKYTFGEKFADVKKDRWSFKYVMYCYEKGITYGTGSDTFSPDATIDAYQFVTLLLRVMGYKDTGLYESLDDAVEYSIFNSAVADRLAQDAFLRDDMVYIIYRSLKAQTSEGNLFAHTLAEKGVISYREAEAFDVYDDFENIDELLNELLN